MTNFLRGKLKRTSKKAASKIHKLPGHIKGVLVVAGVFGLAGSYLLTNTKAATPVTSFEAETSSVTAPAHQVVDGSASGNSALQFSEEPTEPSTGFCNTYPTLPSSKPETSNTGVPVGTNLTAYTGPTTISTAGTVIDGKIINSDIRVTADNVTIKNSRITGGGYYVVNSTASSGVRLIHNEISSSTGGYKYIGVLGKYELICGNYIHGFENPISMYQGGATIQANVIDRLDSPDGGAHYDGIEVYGGGNYRIWGNNISMTDVSGAWRTETGAINISDDSSVIDNVEVNGNWLGGGSFTIYVDDKFAYSISNVKITNNTFYGTPPNGRAAFGTMLIRTPGTVTVNSGNKWESGQPL